MCVTTSRTITTCTPALSRIDPGTRTGSSSCTGVLNAQKDIGFVEASLYPSFYSRETTAQQHACHGLRAICTYPTSGPRFPNHNFKFSQSSQKCHNTAVSSRHLCFRPLPSLQLLINLAPPFNFCVVSSLCLLFCFACSDVFWCASSAVLFFAARGRTPCCRRY